MQIIGVIDLARGRAVHARAGQRDRYQPVSRAAGVPIDGDALALAQTYGRQGVDGIYLADLTAISTAAPPHAVVASIASSGVPLWLDAGVSCPETVAAARRTGAARVIVALETLPAFELLDAICRGARDIAFSLDLRDGAPVAFGEMAVEDIARRAADAGATAMIVIDLACVGMGTGVDLMTIARVRDAVPHTTLVAGGGVRGAADLARLAAAGCDGVLVATALHDGRITAREVADARRLQRSISR